MQTAKNALSKQEVDDEEDKDAGSDEDGGCNR